MAFIYRVASTASQDRLEKLIEERSGEGRPGARRREDWNLFGERWAVMLTDLSGFSRGSPTSASSISCRPSTNEPPAGAADRGAQRHPAQGEATPCW